MQERSDLDVRIARLENYLEDQAVAQGLMDDPRPPFLSEEVARVYRDFRRLSCKTVSVGYGSAAVNVTLDWRAVTEWADEMGVERDAARDWLYAMRDLCERLETKFINEKKGG